MISANHRDLQEVAGPVSRETFERLAQFERVFLKWAGQINLTAKSTLTDVWRRHILDSAQLMPIAPNNAQRWLDLGSGGGFPGLVTGFQLTDRDGAWVDLVESNGKKAGFLRTIIGQFGLPAHVHPQRIEALETIIEPPDIVTARALAPLPILLDLAAPWLTKGAIGLFHKGRDYRQELQESVHLWSFDLVEHRSRIDPDGVILEIRNLRRGPEADHLSTAQSRLITKHYK